MIFDDFAGNQPLKDQIYSLFKDNKVPHCIIFEGAAGTGKKTIAGILAQLAVCSGNDPFCCGECTNCHKAENKIHPDIIYPEKTGTLKTYSVSTVRDIRTDAYIIPNESLRKVYIFSDADDMNSSAQNALLKILEEPPNNVIFIFTCKTSGSFLDTVRSRAQIFSVCPVPVPQATKFILSHYPEFEKDKVEKACAKTNGNIGKTIDILNLTDSNETFLLAEKILNSLVSPRESDIMFLTAGLVGNKSKFKIVIAVLVDLLDSILVNSRKHEIFREIVFRLNNAKILKLIDILNETNSLLDCNVNQNLLVTYFSSNLYSVVFS